MVGFSSVVQFVRYSVRYGNIYSPGSLLSMSIAVESAWQAVSHGSYAVSQFLYGRTSDDDFKKGIGNLSITVLFTYCSFSYWGGLAGMGWFVIDCALPQDQRLFTRYTVPSLVADKIVCPLEQRAIRWISSIPQCQPIVTSVSKRVQVAVPYVQGVVSSVLDRAVSISRKVIHIVGIAISVFAGLAVIFIMIGCVVSLGFSARLL